MAKLPDDSALENHGDVVVWEGDGGDSNLKISKDWF